MFSNIYVKRVIAGFRTPDFLIWMLIFPIILATLFFFAFSNLDAAGQFTEIPVAVVDNEQYRQNTAFVYALNSVSNGDEALFSLIPAQNAEQADNLLDNGEVNAYFIIEGEPKLVIKQNGLHQTIAKSFLDGFLQTAAVYNAIPDERSEALARYEYTKEISLSDAPPSDVVGFYYALLAMVCLYGCFQGLETVTYLQANLSALGARKSAAPVGKFKFIAYDLLGGFTMHFICVLCALLYMQFVLNVSFGAKFLPLLLTCFTGSLLGVAFGSMVAAMSKFKEAVKSGILIGVSMFLSFLSGLMVSGVNYTVAQKAPAAAWLNPAARIADAFYCLYYYDTYNKFFMNIAVISVMSAVMLAICAIFLRRKRYESI